ncbi:class II glutamine amidotransferase [Aquincola sp. S2]|uniref:Class II glutamine amidotransferase n=1 Tax=Pseudaquabacterium terrae TaxID=2732868 RepID=A0ABX2ELV9_9BURK|nr:class II glutamine amidotransferase [Aquabacterium terrae]NRF69647.1 class II glutamine amidotransferase [Aquabacterium terrae]
MCRLLAYLGDPLYLDELVCSAQHSLVRQSRRATQAKTPTNGDGVGIGWYGDRDEPGVYREAMPAWADENLQSLAHTLRSRLFFAHVRAATGTSMARENCHPFKQGRWLFMHNGQIGGYARVRRALEARLPDRLFAARQGSTDSELLFLLTLARIEAGETPDQAMPTVLDDTLALMRAAGVDEPLRFAAALADGDQIYAFRFASDQKPPTLYVNEGDRGSIIASEPLDAHSGQWNPVPPNSWVRLSRLGATVSA